MKIDIVYTWVDGSDPIWDKKRRKRAEEIGTVLPDANNDARFMDNNELKYSLRSVHQFAPWINKIFIVTDNQIPNWLNTDHPKIKIVDHKDIFTKKENLPSFSARGIESQIHHIKQLSEHFIYFNDDMFLGRPSNLNDFFTVNGKPYIFVSEILPIPNRKFYDISKRDVLKRNDHQYAVVNSRKLVTESQKKSVYYNVRHGVKPLLKSVLEQIEKNFSSELLKTSANSFRTLDDVLMFHLFAFYAIIKKLGRPKYLKTVSKKKAIIDLFSSSYNKFTFGYINLHDKNLDENLEAILNNEPFIVCLNQTPSTPDSSIKKIKDFLDIYFPNKSPFEL